MVPVTIRPPHPQNISTTLPTVKMISEVSKSVAILTNSVIYKMLKTKVLTLAMMHQGTIAQKQHKEHIVVYTTHSERCAELLFTQHAEVIAKPTTQNT